MAEVFEESVDGNLDDSCATSALHLTDDPTPLDGAILDRPETVGPVLEVRRCGGLGIEACCRLSTARSFVDILPVERTELNSIEPL